MNDFVEGKHFQKLPVNQCPVCKHTLDAVGQLAEETELPTPGDVVVCFGCTAVLTITEHLGVRVMSKGEIASLDEVMRNELMEIRARIKTVHETFNLER